MKKFLIGGGVGLALILIALISLPFVVDVDRFRPHIESLANDKLNGKVSLGQLSLSLWGRIAIAVETITLVDAQGSEVVTADGAYLNFPLLSLLTGQPRLQVELIEPKIMIVKDQAGELNLTQLVASKAEAGEGAAEPVTDSESAGKDQQPQPSPADPSTGSLPEIVTNAAVSVVISAADITYTDLTSGETQQLNDVDLTSNALQFGEPIAIQIGSELDLKFGELAVQGDWLLKIAATVAAEAGSFRDASFAIDGDFSGLAVSMPDVLSKTSGETLKMQAAGKAGATDMTLESLRLTVGDLVISGDGQLGFSPLTYRFQIKQESIVLQKLQDIVLPLGGLLAEDLAVQTDLLVTTNKVDTVKLDLSSASSEATLSGQIVDFAQPRVDLSIKGKALNLDALFGLNVESSTGAAPQPNEEPAATESGEAAEQAGAEKPGARPAEEVDVDKKVQELMDLELLKGLTAKLLVQLDQVTVKNVDLKQLMTRITFQNRRLLVEPLKFELFDGSVLLALQADLAAAPPTYTLRLDVEDLDLKAAVQTQFEKLRNTMVGELSFDAEGKGRSFNPDLLLKNLVLDGALKLKKASFVTIDIGQMIEKGLAGAIDKVRAKLQQLPPYKPKSLPSKAFGFEVVSSDFTLRNGELNVPNFSALAYENKGVDIEGQMVLNLIDDKLSATWNLVDTYNKSGLEDVDVNEKSIKVEEVFVKNKEPVKIPVVLGCKLSAPCYDYKSIPEHLLKVALQNLKGVVSEKAKAELDKFKKQQQDKLKAEEKKAKEKLKEKAKDLLKGKKLPF